MIEVYRALGDPHRFAIVEMALAKPRYVQEVADELGISQPAVSRHVRVLREAGVVDLAREGRKTMVVCPAASASPELRMLLHWIGVEEVGGEAPVHARERKPERSVEPEPVPTEGRAAGEAPSAASDRSSPPAERDEIEDYLL